MGAVRAIDVAERRARLARRHRLAPGHRTDDVVQIADGLVALHATDPVTVHLSVAQRMNAPSIEALASAMYDERSLVRHHAMRRTLWVFSPAVARLAHASTTARLVPQQQRTLLTLLEQSGEVCEPERWIADARDETVATLRRLGPTSARVLGKAVPALATKLRMSPGKSYGAEISAHTRVLLLLGFEGEIVRTRPTGSWISGEFHWAVADQWLDGGLRGSDIEPGEAAADLADRWLRAFGPARLADLQWWTGWTSAMTSAALARAHAVEVDVDGQPAFVAAGDDERLVSDGEPWVALLPSLDPTTMGWKAREWYVRTDVANAVFDRNGNGGPTIWVDGQIVGSWVQRPSGEIAQGLLVDVGSEVRAAVDEAAEQLRALLAETRFKVRFPAPVQATLLA